MDQRAKGNLHRRQGYSPVSPLVYLFAFLLAACYFASAPSLADKASAEYLVAAPWEIDSAIAAWLISRHVRQGAAFTVIPPSTPLTADQARFAIDVTGGRYVRTHDDSAAGAVIGAHKINDPCAQTLHQFSRVLELSAWRKGQFPNAVMFEQYIRPTLEATTLKKNGTEVLFEAIDEWCRGQK